MNAEVRPMRTSAEQALLQTFAARKAALPGGSAAAPLREAAMASFNELGLPHRRVEAWKYTDLRALMRDAKPLAGIPDAAACARAKGAGAILRDVQACRLALVDGVFMPELSDLNSLPAGVGVRSLAAALAEGDAGLLRNLTPSDGGGDAALALNTALMSDGIVIDIAADARVPLPVHLVYVTASDRPVSLFTRVLVRIGAGAQLTLLETHESRDGLDHQVNHATIISAGDGAKADHVKIAREGDKALHVASLIADLGARVAFNDFIFTKGGAVTRHQVFATLKGEGTDAGLRGVTLLKGRQHADNTLVVDHAAGHCVSREVFKSVLDGESRGVFQGKIIVEPDAQKTDGKMMANALLLSESAEADAKPELEIFADDVVCGHGATAGALDDELLFYLKARGLPAKEAEALLIQAFVGEAIEGIADEGVRDALIGAAVQWLAARG